MPRVLVLLCSLLTAACGVGVFVNPVSPPTAGTTGGSSGDSTAGSTGTSTGAVVSGTTTGPLTNVGCSNDAGLPGADQFMGCDLNIDCACPLACEADLDFGLDGLQCEDLCSGDGGYCDDVETICRQGICRTDFCGADAVGDSRPGILGGLCEAVGGANSGTCLPQQDILPNSGMLISGICVQGGSLPVGHECDDGIHMFSRAYALCQAGSICQGAKGRGTACVAVGPGGCLVWLPDAGSNPGYGDHHPCVTSTYCDCPLSCIQRSASSEFGLCEAPCQDGGGCPQPYTCKNGFCD